MLRSMLLETYCLFKVGIQHDLLARINSSHLNLIEDDSHNDMHQNTSELNFFYGIGKFFIIQKSNSGLKRVVICTVD